MKLKFPLLLLLTFFCITLSAQKTATLIYIDQFKDIAIKEMKRTGIPASITLAQGIVESNSGESNLALNFNNHFGIKCKSDWKGQTTYQDEPYPLNPRPNLSYTLSILAIQAPKILLGKSGPTSVHSDTSTSTDERGLSALNTGSK